MMLIVVALGLTTVGCGTEEGGPRSSSSTVEAYVGSEVVLGGLTVELGVPATAKSGTDFQTELRVANDSGHPVTDPGCRLAATRHGVVPASDPSAELWVITTTDCGGPYTYEPGVREVYSGPTFYAADRYGNALAPGRYFAAWEVDGRRMQYPITIVE